jgi:hypothetical protein
MWPSSKKPENTGSSTPPPPPWENIDRIPQRQHVLRPRFDLVAFFVQLTGLGGPATKMLLLFFSVLIFFSAYIVYLSGQIGSALPPEVNRPAMDKFATSTSRL